MARLTNHDDYDDAAPPPGGGPPEAEEEAEEAGTDQRPAAAISPPPPATNSSTNIPISPATSTGVENHPTSDDAPVPVAQTAAALEMGELRSKRGVEEIDSSGEDAPVPVEMMDTSYDLAEKGSIGAAKSVALGPVPLGYIPDDGSDLKIEAKKRAGASAETATTPQLRVRAGPDDATDSIVDVRDDVFGEDDLRAIAACRRGGVLSEARVRPPPPSMLPTPDLEEPAVPSFHEVHATLVEDEPEQPVYDAVPVGEEHWAKRHQRKIVGGFVLVIVAMAVALGVALGVAFGTGGDDAAAVYGSQCFADSNELQAAVDDYTAGGAACIRGESECEVLQRYGWPIGTWCTSNVTDMSELFQYKRAFGDDLSSWDTSKVTSMEYMFYEASSFNGDVSSFDTSKVTSMSRMFREASAFNGDVSNFDTSKVIDMWSMFNRAEAFNGDVSSWDVASVTDMRWMFSRSSFNRDLSNFDTSQVTSMEDMFNGASSFNQDVSRWDVASVTDMRDMFNGASSFNQNLCAWGVHYNAAVSSSPDWMGDPYANMFLGTKCPNQNDPTGPETNWCAAKCDSAEQTESSSAP